MWKRANPKESAGHKATRLNLQKVNELFMEAFKG